MRKTVALFALALSLLITAIVVALTTSRPVPPAPPSPVTVAPTTMPSASVTFGDVVRVQGQLSHAYVAADHPRTVSLLFDLEAADAPTGPRPDMAVALVVDRSGSMAGDKILQARRAAKQLVSQLGDRDQIAIVTYSSDFAVDLPLTRLEGQRNRINRVIDEILDGGGTNLSGGMQAGLRALRRAGPEVARRLILLSDGNANQGITDPTAIADLAGRARRSGVTISTLGVGVDFNEDLMTLIAQSAAGGYYYARSGRAIAVAFERELQSLKSLAARQVELSLALPAGARLEEVFGYRTEVRGGRTIIPVGDMAANEKRRVMVSVSLDAVAADGSKRIGVLVHHKRPGGHSSHEHHASLAVVGTRDAAKVVLGTSRVVEEAFVSARAARAREEAAASFSSGDRRKAVRSLQNIIAKTKKANASLNSPAVTGQVVEMERTLDELSSYRFDSDAGKDLIKREKLRARQVFTY